MFWSGENKGPDNTNITLLKDTVIKVVEIMAWVGISLGHHNNLHVRHVGTVTAVRYWAQNACSVCPTICYAIGDE